MPLRAYCLHPQIDVWSYPESLSTIAEAFAFCRLHHASFPEIRIVDESNALVLQCAHHTLFIPLGDGLVVAMPLF
jgi:hypothetical protein